ncbi:MAG: phosphatidylserine decarboxylase [Methermicoccaceae archaeon]
MRPAWLYVPLLVVGVVLLCVGLMEMDLLLGLGGVVLLALGGTLVLFFRDPERDVQHDAHVLLSAADGTVLTADAGRVSVFMSMWDVHVNRSPCDGSVVSMHRSTGAHLPAFLTSSGKNSQLSITLASEHSHVEVTLISGMLARRIMPFVKVGDSVQQGMRIGKILLGSRVDVQFGDEWEVRTSKGARVRAGITPIAVLRDDEPQGEREV